MSFHVWNLKDEPDNQPVHKQDEAYYILKGKGRINVNGKNQPVRKGDLIFVPRGAEHFFCDYQEKGLSILIFFSPDFTGPGDGDVKRELKCP